MLSFGQAGFGAGGRNRRIDYFCVAVQFDFFLFDQHFFTNRTVFSFCQASCGTSCGNCRINDFVVSTLLNRSDFGFTTITISFGNTFIRTRSSFYRFPLAPYVLVIFGIKITCLKGVQSVGVNGKAVLLVTRDEAEKAKEYRQQKRESDHIISFHFSLLKSVLTLLIIFYHKILAL